MDEIYPATRHQRCWFHKISNILRKFPKSMGATVKADLQEIHHAETKTAARAAINVFKEKYGVKYAPAVACLAKDEGALLAFYDFPAEHWDHLRTSNPIESVFATVRHRTVRTKGALSQKTVKMIGLHAHPGGVENLAQIERRKSVASAHRKRQIRRWHRKQ